MMTESERKQSYAQPRIKFVPKWPNTLQKKISIVPVDQTEELKPKISSDSKRPLVSPREIITQSITPTINDIKSPTFDFKISSIESATETTDNANLLDRPISTKKIIFRIIIVGIIILICSAAAILPPILIQNLRQSSTNSSTSNQTISVCSSTTCIGSETPYRTSTITALYTFDDNSNDLFGYNNGLPMGSPPSSYGISTAYIYSSVEIKPAKYQYIQIPYMNFKQQSFTIQLWYLIYGSASSIDYGLFYQCGSDSICLGLSIRNGHITLSFDSMNSSANILTGGSFLVSSYWYHITIVYDATLRQQLIYVNGLIDAVSSGITNPYQGTSFGSNTYIGVSSAVNYTSSYFNGAIDHVTISVGVARTTCQIYNDATLFVYYPFDTIDTLLDRSANMIHGISSRLTAVESGRFKQAISFDFNTSYFQAPCYPTIRPDDRPLSVTLWVKPSKIIGGGSLVHVSSIQNGTGTVCYDLLGFTASGILTAQLMVSSSTITSIQGTTLPLNTWTHVAAIYSSKNGLRLFINGQLISSISTAIINNNYNYYITLGNNSPGLVVPSSVCLSTPIAAGSYWGAIDEFRFYMRELNMDELCVLVNG